MEGGEDRRRRRAPDGHPRGRHDASTATRSPGGDCCEGGCSLAPLGGNPLQVVDLDGDGAPEVLLDAFTGGAHCCQLTQILRAGGGRRRAPGAQLGRSGLPAARPRRRRRARSSSPPTPRSATSSPPSPSRCRRSKVLDWRAGTFRNRTRAFPSTVRADLTALRRSLRSLQRRHLPTRGAIAAITADLYSLGRGKDARAYLAGAPGGRAFHARVLKFLHRTGTGRRRRSGAVCVAPRSWAPKRAPRGTWQRFGRSVTDLLPRPLVCDPPPVRDP